jgi:hypothetical protein
LATEKKCKVEGCKRPYKAKGYCVTHHKEWRRGKLGHARFRWCFHEECKKREYARGLCEEHFAAKFGGKKPAAAAAEAPAPAPAAQ